MKIPTYISVFALLAAQIACEASAHDPSSKTAGLPASLAQRMLETKTYVDSIDDQKKGLYSQVIQWPPAFNKLRVCFMGGSAETNSKVAEIAKLWNSSVSMGLKLDFGKSGEPRRCDPEARESQIRISYDRIGLYSGLGTLSVVAIPQEEPSLNLEGFDKLPPEKLADDFERGVILHEFGHALGLLHEHQSPAYACSAGLNWDYINKYMSGPPNNWTPEQIAWNMAVFVPTPEDRMMMTDFDPKSVMLYYFPPEYFMQGANSPCYIPSENNNISETDRATIEYMYPADPAARLKNFETAKSEYLAAVDRAKDKMTKSIGIDLMALYFEREGVPADAE